LKNNKKNVEDNYFHEEQVQDLEDDQQQHAAAPFPANDFNASPSAIHMHRQRLLQQHYRDPTILVSSFMERERIRSLSSAQPQQQQQQQQPPNSSSHFYSTRSSSSPIQKNQRQSSGQTLSQNALEAHMLKQVVLSTHQQQHQQQQRQQKTKEETFYEYQFNHQPQHQPSMKHHHERTQKYSTIIAATIQNNNNSNNNNSKTKTMDDLVLDLDLHHNPKLTFRSNSTSSLATSPHHRKTSNHVSFSDVVANNVVTYDGKLKAGNTRSVYI
jgi:hypothetical protein